MDILVFKQSQYFKYFSLLVVIGVIILGLAFFHFRDFQKEL